MNLSEQVLSNIDYAYVFCGGNGSRLRSVSHDKMPKHLLPVGTKTVLEKSIEPLKELGVKNIVLLTAHHANQVKEYFKGADHLNKNDITIISQQEPLGVRNELIFALKKYPPTSDFFLCDGDGIREGVDLNQLLLFHRMHQAISTMCLVGVQDTRQHHGVVIDSTGLVKEIIPYPDPNSIPGNFIYTGLMICSKNAETHIGDNQLDAGWWGIFTGLIHSEALFGLPLNFCYFNVNTPIETIISDISRGKMVIIVDDENRENEGDVIVAAQTVTRKQIAFMLKEASGLFCIPVAYQLMNKFGFRLLPRKYCRSTNCYFAVPVDLRGNEITTGVSASDRHKLVKKLLDQDVTQRNFETPGHSFPLIARPNGILERQGHTEAVVEIVQLAGFLPIGITVEIVREDGEMARLPDLITFARYHNLHIGTIADLLRYKTSQLDTSRTPSAVDK